jgi:hypothetical protein
VIAKEVDIPGTETVGVKFGCDVFSLCLGLGFDLFFFEG